MHKNKDQRLNSLACTLKHDISPLYFSRPRFLPCSSLPVNLVPCKCNAKSWQALNSAALPDLLVESARSASSARLGLVGRSVGFLPFIAEITKYIIELRVHKRATISKQHLHCRLSQQQLAQRSSLSLPLTACEHEHTTVHVTVTSALLSDSRSAHSPLIGTACSQ